MKKLPVERRTQASDDGCRQLARARARLVGGSLNPRGKLDNALGLVIARDHCLGPIDGPREEKFRKSTTPTTNGATIQPGN